MPCGGIYPISLDPNKQSGPTCFSCNTEIIPEDNPIALACEEWDCIIHYTCLGYFLTSPEGDIVLGHGHEIIAYRWPKP
jgi:hypothetical protein